MEIPTTYVERITAVLPGTSPAQMRINHDGLMNDVVIADDQWAFRFAKTEAGRGALLRESHILALVQRYVRLPAPRFTWHGDDCVAYPFLQGVGLDRNTLLRLEPVVQARLAEQLGTYLRQLHTIPAAELEPLNLAPVQPLTVDAVATELEQIRSTLYGYLWAEQKAWIEQLYAPLLSGAVELTYTPALIHNDLASYHILYDPETTQLSGIIDYGVAEIGDPAADFALIINTYGESFLRQMIPVYGAIEAALDRARFRAGALELWWALQGIRTNDPSWYLVHLGRARDSMPLGWRPAVQQG
jgi:aminoglycoside 2''-phosphotransferase